MNLLKFSATPFVPDWRPCPAAVAAFRACAAKSVDAIYGIRQQIQTQGSVNNLTVLAVG